MRKLTIVSSDKQHLKAHKSVLSLASSRIKAEIYGVCSSSASFETKEHFDSKKIHLDVASDTIQKSENKENMQFWYRLDRALTECIPNVVDVPDRANPLRQLAKQFRLLDLNLKALYFGGEAVLIVRAPNSFEHSKFSTR